MDEELNYIKNFINSVPKIYYSEKLSELNFTNGYVLDFGCGPGQWSVELSKSNKFVISVDSNEKFINYLKNKIKDEKLLNIDVICNNVLHFNSEKKFEYILCSNIIQYLPKKKTVQLLSSLLEKNGKIFVSTHDLGYYILKVVNNCKEMKSLNVLKYLYLIFRSLVVNFFNLDDEDMFKETYISKKNLLRLLLDNGFEIEQIKIGGHPVLKQKYFMLSPCFYEIVAKKIR